jgi:hypothetical protein
MTTSASVTTVESGNIYFCFRPKVGRRDVSGLGDIQRFFIILKPQGKKTYRKLVIGHQRLPDINRHGQSVWGFVDSVTKSPQEIESGLRSEHYTTQTRGGRQVPAACPVGEGVYELVQHGDHTHLVFALELPATPGPAQEELNIPAEASYVVQIRNPMQGANKVANKVANKGSNKTDARRDGFPRSLQARFRNRRFISEDVPEFLDHAGAEILLVAASQDVSGELGIALDRRHETEATADIINDLRMRKSRHPIKPLFAGEWA